MIVGLRRKEQTRSEAHTETAMRAGVGDEFDSGEHADADADKAAWSWSCMPAKDWKRFRLKLKDARKQGLIRSPEFQQHLLFLDTTRPDVYLKQCMQRVGVTLNPSQADHAQESATLNPESSSIAMPSSLTHPLLPALGSPPVSLSPLFVLGDSHSLPLHSRWLCCFDAAQQRLNWIQMRSKVIVGLKAWHVGMAGQEVETRAPVRLQHTHAHNQPNTSHASADSVSSHLHPARILLAYAPHIPRGSTVLLVAGEIDCRNDEGILEAVRKGKFSSQRAAIHTTIERYLDGVERLAQQYGWLRVFIHPVTPPYLAGNKKRNATKGWKDFNVENQRQRTRQHTYANTKTNTSTNDIDVDVAGSMTIPSLLYRVYQRARLIQEFNVELRRQVDQRRCNKGEGKGEKEKGMEMENENENAGSRNRCPIELLDFYSQLCEPSSPAASASASSPSPPSPSFGALSRRWENGRAAASSLASASASALATPKLHPSHLHCNGNDNGNGENKSGMCVSSAAGCTCVPATSPPSHTQTQTHTHTHTHARTRHVHANVIHSNSNSNSNSNTSSSSLSSSALPFSSSSSPSSSPSSFSSAAGSLAFRHATADDDDADAASSVSVSVHGGVRTRADVSIINTSLPAPAPAPAAAVAPLLLREYTLEGLHLNHKYLPILERALQHAINPSPSPSPSRHERSETDG